MLLDSNESRTVLLLGFMMSGEARLTVLSLGGFCYPPATFLTVTERWRLDSLVSYKASDAG